MIIMKKYLFATIALILVFSCRILFAQEEEKKVPVPILFAQEDQSENPYVLEVEFQIPLNKLDSLEKLFVLIGESGYINKAVEMGYILDSRAHILQIGEEWNVKIQWIYPSWDSMNEDWDPLTVWNATGLDEEEIKKVRDGTNGMFSEAPKRNRIYRLITYAK
jgi:hypothetical protein